MDVATQVKMAVYGMIADSGRVPDAAQVARQTGTLEADVLGAFERLRQNRLLVLEAGDPTRIRMAPPFSGVPTAFLVHARGRDYYANCVWDAFGVAAALHSDAVIDAVDGHTGEPMTLQVKDGALVPCKGVAHFAVPAARWFADIVFT